MEPLQLYGNVMKSLLVVLVLLTVSIKTNAQGKSTDYNLSLEADLLPYSLGGYFGALAFGDDNMRIRAIGASATKPDIILPSGFTKNTLQAYALLLDYFPYSKNYSGFWCYTGVVYWSSTIQNKDDNSKSAFTNTLFSVGGGYSYYFFKDLYVSPWAGLHVRVAGDKSVPVGAKTFEVALLNSEASVKIGWCFTLFTKNSSTDPLSH